MTNQHINNSLQFLPDFWQACFDAMPLQVCILNQDGHICCFNHAWLTAAQKDDQYFASFTIGAHLPSVIASHTIALTDTENFLLQFQPALQTLLSGARAQARFDFSVQSSATLRWFRAHLSAMPKYETAAFFLLGLEEITQLKLEIEATQTANLVYQYSNQAIIVTDAKNQIIAINPAYTQLTGFTSEDVLGKNPSFASSGRHTRDFYQLMWHALQTNGSWQGEMWNMKKDGTEIVEWLTINAITDGIGHVIRYVAIFSDITEQKQQQELQWKHANFDALTALPNRRLMLDRLNTELRKAYRNTRQVAVMFVDLDHFKQINDQLGHAMGDVVLIETAHRLSSCVRESDTVARMGGDEFILILGDLQDTSDIKRIANTVLNSLAQPYQLNPEHAVCVSGSIGIAVYPQDAENSLQLIEYADQAMYHAKRAGKNQFHYFARA